MKKMIISAVVFAMTLGLTPVGVFAESYASKEDWEGSSGIHEEGWEDWEGSDGIYEEGWEEEWFFNQNSPAVFRNIGFLTNGHGMVEYKKSAIEGTNTDFTCIPDMGFKVGSISVTDEAGTEIAVTAKSDGSYGFKMPESDVAAKVIFVKDGFVTEGDVMEDLWRLSGAHGGWYDMSAEDRGAAVGLWAGKLFAADADFGRYFSPDHSYGRRATMEWLYDVLVTHGMFTGINSETYNKYFDLSGIGYGSDKGEENIEGEWYAELLNSHTRALAYNLY